MAYIPAPATARTEQVSTTNVQAPLRRGTLVLNVALVAQTLASAKRQAGFTTPRPSAPMTMYVNPDGTVCTSRAESVSYDRQGLYS